MDLLEFGSALKNRRVAQQVSLTDIAAETRINIRFLEAIERGDFHVLPQTYVRAFLREYALIVDLPAEEVMRQYDEILGTPAQATAPHPESSSVRIEASGLSRQQKRVLAVGGGIIVLLAVALFITLQPGSEPMTTPEVSFDRVIRENEAAALRQRPIPAPFVPPVIVDSLRLEIFTTDSVWVSLVADTEAAQEFLFAPNRTRRWMAKERFLLTMGNAGGATFRLNGTDLGALGRRGAVLRNIPITHNTVKPPPVVEQPAP